MTPRACTAQPVLFSLSKPSPPRLSLAPGGKPCLYHERGLALTPPNLHHLFPAYIIKLKKNDSCEIKDFVETHLRKLRGILQLRVLRVLCDLIKDAQSFLYICRRTRVHTLLTEYALLAKTKQNKTKQVDVKRRIK